MATCLVTGGAGFIGSNIVRRLVDEGHGVRVLDDLSTGRRENLEGLEEAIDFREGDIRDEATTTTAVQGVDAVFHLAALPSVVRSVEEPLETNRVNVCGTLRMLIAARDAGVDRFVFSSSSSVYGDTPVLPKQEDMLPGPLSPYAIQKLTGEHYCRVFYGLYGLKTYVLRYFNVFGPNQNPESHYAAVIPLFINALQNDRPVTIFGDGGQTRDFTYVEDVVSANLSCLEAPETGAGGIYNIACGDRTSVNDMARHLMAIMGKDINPVHEPARVGDVRDSQGDGSRAYSVLGWQPAFSLQQGLEQTVRYFTTEQDAQ